MDYFLVKIAKPSSILAIQLCNSILLPLSEQYDLAINSEEVSN